MDRYIPVKKGNILSEVAAAVCSSSLPEISDVIGSGSLEEVKESIIKAQLETEAGETEGLMQDLVQKIAGECITQVKALLTAAYVDGAGAEDDDTLEV